MPKITDCEIIKNRIEQVRHIMTANNIDVYMVATGDYHISEYSGEYFNEREFLTGFTGSAGTAVITKDSAALFTDGRYYVQAELQLMGTGITLMRQSDANVLSLSEYCREKLLSCKERSVLGFDGRTVGARLGMELNNMAEGIGSEISDNFNAVEKIFTDRLPFPHSPAYMLDDKFTGESIASKLSRVRLKMKEFGADMHFTASLDDVCWLYNIRGNDVECNPVIMAYSCVLMDRAYIYTDRDRFDETIVKIFSENNIFIKDYNQVYKDIMDISETCVVLVDSQRVNYLLYNTMKNNHNITIQDKENPEVRFKAVKNKTELDNLKSVHIEDGLALTRFIKWVKEKVCDKEYDGKLTEVTAARYLDELRSRINDYVEPSFPTISAYNENAAMMHYSATDEYCAVLKPEGMLLVDSGGQYLRGTTDVTRTIALGEVPLEWKRYYTLVLKGMLSLSDAHFLKGCTGYNLDILARAPLWEEGIDYKCGTGHGIGYLLNVHESPNGFRWKHIPGKNDLAVIEEGMVTSDEPGVYIDGEMGIRIENEIVCVRDFENEYGTFLKFDVLTIAPLEMELIDMSILEKKDIERINRYNEFVYEKLSPLMNDEEKEWLGTVTQKL